MAIDGKYRLILNSPFTRMKVILELTEEHGRVAGRLWGGGLSASVLEDGEIKGNRLSWKVTQPMFSFSCVAMLDGDNIEGEADYGYFGKAWMRGSRMDDVTGKSSVDAEPAIAWKDMGLPRYEYGSREWVDAFGAWLRSRSEGQTFDFDYGWSMELTDPPKHLLRDDGRDTIGWHFVMKNGKLECGDGPLKGDVDFGHAPAPYALLLETVRLTTDQLVALREQTPPTGLTVGERQLRLAPTQEALYKLKRVNDLIAGPGNVIREEFWSQQTL
jgi:hypothetical protein